MRLSLALPILLLLAAAGATRAVVAQETASAASQPDESARALVARCVSDSGATGLEALEAACPGLGAALDRLQLTPAFVEGTREKLDAPALQRLLNATRPAANPGPDPARLADVMHGLRAEPESPSLWERFKHWVERTFLSRGEGSAFPWLTSWLERLSPGALLRELIVWGLVIAVVGAAVFVVVRELRASDVRWGGWLRRGQAAAPVESGAALASGEDWRRLSVAEQPAALFRHVVRRLGAEGRLPALGSHTHRELRQRARLDAAEEREAWQALASAAERQIYAPAVSADDAERAVAQAVRVWAPPP